MCSNPESSTLVSQFTPPETDGGRMSVKIASVVQHCEWFMPAGEASDKYEGENPDDTELQVY